MKKSLCHEFSFIMVFQRGLQCFTVFLLVLSVSAVSIRGGTSYEENERITVIRDQWGIPHIFAETDAGAMFALGYVSAEDRLFQMEYSRRVIQGRLAEMLGDIGPRNKSTLTSDIENRHLQYYSFCQQAADNLDAETRDLLEAFCEGVNDYSKRNQHSLLYLFDVFYVFPEPWTPADCLAVWMRIASFFSPNWKGKAKVLHQYEDLIAGGMSRKEAVEALTNERIIDEEAAVVQENDFNPLIRAELEAYAQKHGYQNSLLSERLDFKQEGPEIPQFSHAWVFGGSRTTTGSSVLNSDPQTTVRNPSVWYEFHLSAETFNVRGIGVAGCPGLLIGWNENIAWGVTALGADMADIFRLNLKAGENEVYLYDGQDRNIESWNELISVRGGTA